MVWTNLVRLTDPSCFIYGPFHFESHFDTSSVKVYIALRHFESLLTSRNALGIVLPIISTLADTNLKKKRKTINMNSITHLVCKCTSSDTLLVLFPALFLVLSLDFS